MTTRSRGYRRGGSRDDARPSAEPRRRVSARDAQCLLAQEVILSRALVAVTFEAGALQLQTDQAGLRRQPFPASDGMRVRCLDVSLKFYLKVKLLQREEQPLAPRAPREPSKWVRNARRASERAKESDIDRSSFYL